FIGQGLANIISGVFQGISVSGSFSATALSVNSGARTRFANITAGITMGVILLLFGNSISFLALPSLAGLLIVVGYRIIKMDDVMMVWKIGPIQQTIMLITFSLTLIIPLQYAVFNGVALSLLMFVARQSNKVRVMEWVRRPGELPIEQKSPAEVPAEKVLILLPYGSLFFAAAQTFEEELPNVTAETSRSVVILNLRQREDLGSTFLNVLDRYGQELREQNSRLMLSEVSDEVMDNFIRTGYMDIFGRDNIFHGTERVFEATLEAQHQAEKWIAEQKEQPKP
ncbi:MAG TPA: SulP family inorganic anion transporter, partial [Chloroflexi bacterium]|nr:SulP family inorganic anion transporter [Chloroflexota bacterium]